MKELGEVTSMKEGMKADDDALILSFWLLGLAPSSLGLQELNFPGTGLSITRGR